MYIYLLYTSNVQMCVFLSINCLLIFPPCCFFSATIISSEDTGWDASWHSGMCYHSNKLTHWQDCSISHWATGRQQQMQPLSCGGFVCEADAGRRGDTPLFGK